MSRILSFKRIVPMLMWLIALMSIGCASMSLRETAIRAKLPSLYKNHSTGIIIAPSEEDVQQAINLGELSKDNNILDYAYLIKPNLDTYIHILPPLYLISDHSRNQAREYLDIDQDFVDYCKSLSAVKIAVQTQSTSQYTYNVYAQGYSLILLRDGKRVPHLTKINGYKGKNPFIKPPKLNKELQALVEKSEQMAEESMRRAEESLKALQKSLGQIPKGLPKTNTREVVLSESDGIFDPVELKKTGHYEIIYRTPPTSNLFRSGDKEIRYTVSFDQFR